MKSNTLLKEEPGIYKITNIVTGKVYVGSGIKVRRRYYHHRHHLLKNKHCNTHLQRSFNKYGKDKFIFELIEYCSKDELFTKEQYWYEQYKDNTYNVRAIVNSNFGVPFSEDRKQKLRSRLITPAFREQARQRMLGTSLSDQTKDRIRIANMGKTSYNVEAATTAKLKSISEIDSMGNVINTWLSVKACASELNVKDATIRDYILGRKKSYRLKGRRFRYE